MDTNNRRGALFQIGDHVTVSGLQTLALNGKQGSIISLADSNNEGRYGIRVMGISEPWLMKAEHLQPTSFMDCDEIWLEDGEIKGITSAEKKKLKKMNISQVLEQEPETEEFQLLRKYVAVFSSQLYQSGTPTLRSDQKMNCVTDLEQAVMKLNEKLIRDFGTKGSDKLSNLKATIVITDPQNNANNTTSAGESKYMERRGNSVYMEQVIESLGQLVQEITDILDVEMYDKVYNMMYRVTQSIMKDKVEQLSTRLTHREFLYDKNDSNYGNAPWNNDQRWISNDIDWCLNKIDLIRIQMNRWYGQLDVYRKTVEEVLSDCNKNGASSLTELEPLIQSVVYVKTSTTNMENDVEDVTNVD